MKIFQDMYEFFSELETILYMESILDMEVKHNTLYCTLILRREKMLYVIYNMCLGPLLIAVNPKRNDLLSVALLIQCLNN